jgi:uncharacterized protein YndB with AHSA1/START domain
MSTQASATSVRNSIVVEAPIERAFSVFTEGFGSFKPPEHNMLPVDIEETVFETHVGGHIYDRGVDGSECRWARVLAFEPPDRVVFSWDISPHWQIETDPDRASEVEVRFVAEAPGRTRVELEHRNLDRHGEGWAVSIPLTKARTLRPVISSTVPVNSLSLACWKKIRISRTRWSSPKAIMFRSAGVRLFSIVARSVSGPA